MKSSIVAWIAAGLAVLSLVVAIWSFTGGASNTGTLVTSPVGTSATTTTAAPAVTGPFLGPVHTLAATSTKTATPGTVSYLLNVQGSYASGKLMGIKVLSVTDSAGTKIVAPGATSNVFVADAEINKMLAADAATWDKVQPLTVSFDVPIAGDAGADGAKTTCWILYFDNIPLWKFCKVEGQT